MIEIIPYEERWLGRLLDFSVAAAPGFFYSWAGNEEMFRWKLVEQPCLGAGEQIPVWLAVDGGQIIGVRAAILSDYWYDGQTIHGCVGGDFYVRDSYQGQGIGRLLWEQLHSIVPLHLHINSAEKSHRMHLQKGGIELPGLTTSLVIHKPLSAVAWLIWRKLRGSGGRGIPRPIDSVRDWLLAQPEVTLLADDTIDEADALLAEAQRRFAFAALRDSKFLLWKYRQQPEQHGDVFIWHDDGQLSAVFAFANQNRGGLHILMLADLYMRESNAACANHIAALLHGAANTSGADASGVFGNWALLTDACHHGLFKHQRPHLGSLLVAGSSNIFPDPCYINAGDGDYLC